MVDVRKGIRSQKLCSNALYEHYWRRNIMKWNDLAPKDTAYTAVTVVWQTLCKLCLPLPPPAMGARLPFLDKPVMRTRWMAGIAPHKSRRCRDESRSDKYTQQVWMGDIGHRQIQVRNPISIRCNRIEHWVHLRCAGIRLAQYTDSWTCHQLK